MQVSEPARGLVRARRGARRPAGLRAVPGLVVLLLGLRPGGVAAQTDIPGRLVVELTEAGARAFRAGTLELPAPAGVPGPALHLEPLFVSRTGPLSRFVLATFDPGRSGSANRDWIEVLGADPRVHRAEPDRVFRVAALPDDPYFAGNDTLPSQFHLANPGGLSLHADEAWPFVPAGSAVPVAVLDSGIDLDHPDFGGPAGALWTNAAEAAGLPGVDDDGNGFIDDVDGWDFVDITVDLGPDANPAPGEDGTVPDADPRDQAGHGTQVAGLITAIRDNGIGIAGAAPGVRLMPVRVSWLGRSGTAYVIMSFCAQGMEYAALNGARVANCSWNSGNIEGLGAAVDLAINTFDMVIVGSAGNDGTSSTAVQYLASRSDVLGVGGILESGAKANKSNYGVWVAVSAFYRGMPTTYFNRNTAAHTYIVNSVGGTSFASPQVAGLAAVLRAVDPAADQSLIRATITGTARDLSDVEPVFAAQLGGLADYRAAVQSLGGGWNGGRAARGLTAVGDGDLAFLGDSTLSRVSAATGLDAPSWTPGVARLDPGSPEPPPARVPGSVDIVVWSDGLSVQVAGADGSPPFMGWPVALPRPARSVVTTTWPGLLKGAYLPLRSGLFVVTVTGGVPTTDHLDWPVDALAAADLDAEGNVLLAGIDSLGAVHRATYQAGLTPLSDPGLSGRILPPVIGEFDGPGIRHLVVAGTDSQFVDGMPRVWFVNEAGEIEVTAPLPGPPLTALSLAGFAGLARLEAVAVDSAGGIHLVDRSGTVRTVSASGPVAGEVRVADLDGDYESDLLVLTRSGRLEAWNDALEPLSGYPREFPAGFAEGPAVVDAGGRRYVVAADTAGGLWSLPAGPADRPAPWPAADGAFTRSRYLGHDRGTPVAPTARLTWADGTLCWDGTGLETLTALRVTRRGETLWSGPSRAEACVALGSPGPGSELRFEGRGRTGDWALLGILTTPGGGGLTGFAAFPNPTRAASTLRWSGAAGPLELRVIDVQGRLVTRVALPEGTGEYRWDGRDPEGRVQAPGVYFVRIRDRDRERVLRILRLP